MNATSTNTKVDATAAWQALAQVESAALQMLDAIRQAGKGVLPSGLSQPGQSQANLSRPARQTPGMVTVGNLCNEFVASKELARRSDRYLRLLRTEVASFASGRESQLAATISSAEIEKWLHGQGWSARTMKGRLLTLRSVFTWAVNRAELAANPALGVDVPFDENGLEPPCIHTPERVKEVLEIARKIDLNTMRCLAIRYFAGLRTSEATSLDESEIRHDYIEVTARKSKTRRRRLVTIQPNLRLWLDLGGVLPLRQANNRLRALTAKLAFQWEANAPRHSFVSYHLAKFESAGKTALEAGHSEQMLFKHYRAIVTREGAMDYFNIMPQ